MNRFLAIIFCVSFSLLAQSISVSSITDLSKGMEGSFYYPQYNSDDSKLVLTSENYKGIWIYDLTSKSINKINDEFGAGYFPMFTNPDIIYYRTDEYVNGMKYSSLKSYSLKDRNILTLIENKRFLSEPIRKSGERILYTNNYTPEAFSETSQSLESLSSSEVIAFIENSDLILFSGGEKKVFNPMGNGNYIWQSISNDNSKVLFTLAGKGTYITDLSGKVLHEIGKANAPLFSPDGKFVVYMVDKDNGDFVTESSIWVYSLSNGGKTQLTNANAYKAMYPKWSNSGNKIVFNTTDGKIYEISLKID